MAKIKTGIKNAAETTGKVVTALGIHTLIVDQLKKIANKSLPRPILDYLIDHLDNMEQLNTAGSDAEKAANQLKQRLEQARKKHRENKVVTALCKILEIDKEGDGKYTKDFPMSRKRLKEYGLMTEEDFWQSIETLIDDLIQERISAITDPIAEQLKKIKLEKIKKTLDFVAGEMNTCNEITRKNFLGGKK